MSLFCCLYLRITWPVAQISVTSFSIDQFSYAEENSQTTAFRRQNTQNVGWMKRQFSAAKPLAASTHLCLTVSQLFEPQVQKIAVFMYRSPHFCFPWRRLCDCHAICSMDGKTIQCLPNPRSMYLSIFNNFRVIRCLSQCVSSKISIFTTFLFPLGTPLGQSR